MISILPPKTSDFDFSLYPKYFPMRTPKKDMIKVVIPINKVAEKIFTDKKAKVMPTVSASILVAIAKLSISLKAILEFALVSQDSLLSLSILIPIKERSTKAII